MPMPVTVIPFVRPVVEEIPVTLVPLNLVVPERIVVPPNVSGVVLVRAWIVVLAGMPVPVTGVPVESVAVVDSPEMILVPVFAVPIRFCVPNAYDEVTLMDETVVDPATVLPLSSIA